MPQPKYLHVAISTTEPVAGEIEFNQLWFNPTDKVWRKCTAIKPMAFESCVGTLIETHIPMISLAVAQTI